MGGIVGEERRGKKIDGCPLTRVFSLDFPWLDLSRDYLLRTPYRTWHGSDFGIYLL
jgi:hypothetical protein